MQEPERFLTLDHQIKRIARWVARSHGLVDPDDLTQAAWLILLESDMQAAKTHPRAIMQTMWAVVRQEWQQHGKTLKGSRRVASLPVWLPAPPAYPWLAVYLHEILDHLHTCTMGRAYSRCLLRHLTGETHESVETRYTYLKRARQHLRRWERGNSCYG